MADNNFGTAGNSLVPGHVAMVVNGSSVAVPAAVASADAASGSGILETSHALFNGTTFDRARGNLDTGALITGAAAAAGVNLADQSNVNGRGLQLTIDVTAITGTTPSLTVTIQGKDTASGKYFTLLASAALTGVGTTVLRVYPGLVAAANLTANDILSRTWRVVTVIAGTTPAVTYTVGASVIL